MKFLKYLLFLILGLWLVFLSIGFFVPSVDYGYTIDVPKSVEEAWAVHQDESKYSLWLKGLTSIELINGEAGVVGSQYKVVVNPGEDQEDFEMIETLQAIEKEEKIILSFDSDMMVFEQQTYFRERDGRTSIRTDCKVKGKGMMMRSMFALMEILGGTFEAQEKENMNALMQVILENTTDYNSTPAILENEAVDKKENTNG